MPACIHASVCECVSVCVCIVCALYVDCVCIVCVCRLRNAFFFCCLFFRFFPCFLLSLRRTIFFFEFEGKIRSFLSFLCREEEFITLKEEDKEDKEELKKRRAESFCSRSVSRPLSSSLSAGAKRERESGVFFSKSKSLPRAR